ncbi:PilN domain-containing protein [Bacillus sp. FJAT-45066]|uniref:PilN domain-containing protein n=1 Tax=Bacillus sp. FJAT-45066 TaxID=2011010 RepID=UPI000BB78B33|nr:hypothetical protein [Bacillus sp. FJAT-45066]
MLVDINLLPKKQARDITMPAVIGISIFFILFTVVALLAMNYFVQRELNKSQVTLDQAVQLRIVMEEAAKGPQATSSVIQLQQSIDWVESQSQDVVPILNHIVGILPASGYIDNFLYTLDGAISVTVKFDNQRDAAYYLHHLTLSPFVQEATLSSITSSDEGTTGQYTINLNKAYLKGEQERGDR